MLEPKYIFNKLPDEVQHYLRFYQYKFLKTNEFTRLQDMRYFETNDGYSLKPFDECKCIFVHIPKCAGISLTKSLFGNLAGGHRSLKDYRFIYHPKEFNKYFKFTFVRNPWDRLVSAYFFMKSGGINTNNRQWSEYHLSEYSTFDEFVKRWLTKDNIKLGLHFKPQYKFVCNSNMLLMVDYVGYFENLLEDYEIIRKKIGSDKVLMTSNVGKDRKKDYTDYYSDETRAIVADVYQEDIKLFGYNFYGRDM